MSQQLWNAVESYLNENLVPADPILQAGLERNIAAGLPPIDVAPHEGKLLYLLAKIRGARRILEIGTLGGYSTTWLARALPEDELDPKHAQVAGENIRHAGVASHVEIRVGPALDSLKRLCAEKAEPFDFIFIDADKPGYPAYLDAVLELSKSGTVIVADNVVREGGVADQTSKDPSVKGVRSYIEKVAANPHLEATVLQTVGSKGYDGFALAVVR